MKSAISVSALIRYLKRTLDHNEYIQNIYLKGEISNFVRHRSGHCYFSLKDNAAKISCVIFASHTANLKIKAKDNEFNGKQVLVRGNISMFEAGGTIQLYVESMEEEGLGALYQKLEELKQRLSDEGLFDPKHKKPLIPYPNRIAVISAKEGAATQDVFTTLQRRWPIAEILFFPTLVQGNGAAAQIAQTLQLADTKHCDVILLVRGGGSIEDLWAFNEEMVIRAVANCQTVVVSGVGHETDTTLVDYVSDHRAPTPTAAAELATPNIIDVRQQLQTFQTRLLNSAALQLKHKTQQLTSLSAHPFLRNPGYLFQQKQQQLDSLTTSLLSFPSMLEQKTLHYERLKHRFLAVDIGLQTSKDKLRFNNLNLINLMKNQMTSAQQKLLIQITKLEANSPLTIMKKGYAMTFQDNQLIHSIEDITMSKEVNIQYADGTLTAQPLKKETTS